MEVIISKEVFQTLLDKIEEINKKLETQKNKSKLKDDWLDIQETCDLLKVSKRTLQYYRQRGLIPYSQVNGKYFFKLTDIQKTLEKNYQNIKR